MPLTCFHRSFSPSCTRIWRVTTLTQSSCATSWTHGLFLKPDCTVSWPYFSCSTATGLCFCWTCHCWLTTSTSSSRKTTCWTPLRSSEHCPSTRRRASPSWDSTCWCSSSTCTEWSWLWSVTSRRHNDWPGDARLLLTLYLLMLYLLSCICSRYCWWSCPWSTLFSSIDDAHSNLSFSHQSSTIIRHW